MTAAGADTGAGLPESLTVDVALGTVALCEKHGVRIVALEVAQVLATALDAATDAARALEELEAIVRWGYTGDGDRAWGIVAPDIGGDPAWFWYALRRTDDNRANMLDVSGRPDTYAECIRELHAALTAANELPPLPGDGDSGAAGGGGR